jgi:hypothetical protein
MAQEKILLVFTIIAGIVAVFELLEYVFTKNLPWLVRLGLLTWRQVRRWWRRRHDDGSQRYLILNFSSHPVLPGQQQAILQHMGWPIAEVLSAEVGNIKENSHFVRTALRHIDRLDLTPTEWQTLPLVVLPAGYASLWSAILAELHGRLGYFPDVVRLRPAPAEAEERFEVAEVMRLQDLRNVARGKRGTRFAETDHPTGTG